MKLLQGISILLYFSSLPASAAFVQSAPGSDHVKLTTAEGEKIPFHIAGKIRFEWVNGLLNAAVSSTEGLLLEINGISEKELGKEADLAGNFTAVLIDAAKNTSYKLSEKDIKKLHIKSKSNKKDEAISLTFSGVLTGGKKKINISCNLKGRLPAREFRSMNH